MRVPDASLASLNFWLNEPPKRGVSGIIIVADIPFGTAPFPGEHEICISEDISAAASGAKNKFNESAD